VEQLTKVFVYGTLKKGYGNNYLLDDATFISQAETVDNYALFDMGAYPAITTAIPGDSTVKGEVYEVNKNVMNNLDYLENYPDLYDRSCISVILKETGMKVNAWTYHMKGKCKRGTLIEGGIWMPSFSEEDIDDYVDDIVEMLDDKGVDNLLDEYVRIAASMLANDINQEGFESQVRFLLNCNKTPEQIKNIIKKS
jgi:gamma-glutamylcyclotransferase (GGCT)/AIG2-like uncharacterized protein YtfP